LSNDELADELEKRAAAIRRAAGTLDSPEGREELLGIAAGYEAQARSLRPRRPLKPY
jgi:hypothetical protein